jgi:hypothetical protein
MILVFLSSRASCRTSGLKVQGIPMHTMLLGMEEEYTHFILVILQFLCCESLILPAKHLSAHSTPKVMVGNRKNCQPSKYFPRILTCGIISLMRKKNLMDVRGCKVCMQIRGKHINKDNVYT